MYNKYTNGTKVIHATEKAYNVIYKYQGFKEFDEVVESKATQEPTREIKEDINVIAYEDMTKAQISTLLSERGVEYNSRDNKGKLIELLLGSD